MCVLWQRKPNKLTGLTAYGLRVLCPFANTSPTAEIHLHGLASTTFFHVVAVSDTYRDNISDGYSIPDEIPTTLAFSSVNWCKIDVFTSNIMVLHHKMSQTVKINVKRHTNLYLLMNLFKINQFIFLFPVFQLYFHSYNKQIFLIILYFCCC